METNELKTEDQLREEYRKVIEENLPFGFEYYEELFQWILNERKQYASQLLDKAAEEAKVIGVDFTSTLQSVIDKQSILKLKELLK